MATKPGWNAALGTTAGKSPAAIWAAALAGVLGDFFGLLDLDPLILVGFMGVVIAPFAELGSAFLERGENKIRGLGSAPKTRPPSPKSPRKKETSHAKT